MNVNKRTKIAAILRDAKAKIAAETVVICDLSLVYSQKESTKGAEALFVKMCERWGVTPEWLSTPVRSDSRPIMRDLFWLAAKRAYPKVTYTHLTKITGVTSYSTAVTGVEKVKRWISIRDAAVMKYYVPVAEFVEFTI